MKIEIKPADLDRLCSRLDRWSIPYSMVRYSPADRIPFWVLDVEGASLATVVLKEDQTLISLDLLVYSAVLGGKDNA